MATENSALVRIFFPQLPLYLEGWESFQHQGCISSLKDKNPSFLVFCHHAHINFTALYIHRKIR